MSDFSPVSKQCVAACKFVAASTTFLRQRGIVAVVANGPGDFTFELGTPVASEEQIVTATLTGALAAAGASISATYVDDTHVRVTTSNETALANLNFNLVVEKLI